MDQKDLRVGIADYKVGKSPDRLMTIGLGSCVGIAILDKKTGIAGLAHIMLPSSDKFSDVSNFKKFADLALPKMIEEMVKLGATERNMQAKIAGGASMFNFSDSNSNMDIGNRNSTEVKKILKTRRIPIISEEIGGTKGRTITFDSATGDLHVKTVGEGVKVV